MSWTDERVEKLKGLWADGLSASQIAKDLGGVTRNAVIGKVHRLGLPARTPGGGAKADTAAAAEKPAKPTKKAAAKTTPTPKPAAPKPAPVKAAPEPEPELPEVIEEDDGEEKLLSETGVDLLALERKAKKINLMELTERVCKWPIGDPTSTEFHFCGQPSVAGKPYCEGHVSVAFQPMSTRRERDRKRQAQRSF